MTKGNERDREKVKKTLQTKGFVYPKNKLKSSKRKSPRRRMYSKKSGKIKEIQIDYTTTAINSIRSPKITKRRLPSVYYRNRDRRNEDDLVSLMGGMNLISKKKSRSRDKMNSGNSTIDKCKGKVCKKTQICNPKSGRCVSKKGKIGKELLKKNKRISPKRKVNSPKAYPKMKNDKCKGKVCKKTQICNPKSGRCVSKKGKIGKELLKKKRKSPTPKRKSPTPKRKSPTPKRKSPTPKRKSPTPKRKSPKFNWNKLVREECCNKVPNTLQKESDLFIKIKSGAKDYANIQANPNRISEKIKKQYKNIEKIVREFQKRGGNVVMAPEETEKTDFSIGIQKGDVLIPVCHAGQNRSQMMYALLCGVKRRMDGEVTVLPPHGADSGFDPHAAYENLNIDNFIEYILSVGVVGDDLDKRQAAALGTKKCERIGHFAAKDRQLNPLNMDKDDFKKVEKDRSYMRKWFDKNFYSMKTDSNHKRILLFSFLRAGPIMMKRFLETRKSLKGIYMIMIPWGDPVPRSGSTEHINREIQKGDKRDRESIRKSLVEKAIAKTFKKYSELIFIKKKVNKNKSGMDSFIEKININGAKIAELNEKINSKSLEIAMLISKINQDKKKLKNDNKNVKLVTDIEFKDGLAKDMKKDLLKLQEEMEIRSEEMENNKELVEILNSDNLSVPKYRKLQYLVKEMKKQGYKDHVRAVSEYVLKKFKRPIKGI